MRITATTAPLIEAGYERLDRLTYGGINDCNVSVSHRDSNGDWFAGLSFSGDADTDHEVGAPTLRNTLVGDDKRAFAVLRQMYGHVAVCSDRNALALSSRPLAATAFAWGEPLGTDTRYAARIDYGNERRDVWLRRDLQERPMTQLRQLCQEHDLQVRPRSKQQAVEALLADDRAAFWLGARHNWRGSFTTGTTLVVRADDGPAALMLEHLRQAVADRSLGIGGHTFGARGIFLFDVRDVPPQLLAERQAEFDWQHARLAELEPVKAELKRRGFGWFFLGKPTRSQRDGIEQVRYWLNPTEQQQHDCGWFSLEELLAEQFVKAGAGV